MVQFEKSGLEGESTVGGELRIARHAKGLSLKEAARKLKINAKYLQAIEEGALKRLPSGIYALNYLREYCILLGVDYYKIKIRFEEERRHRESQRPKVFERQVVDRKLFIIVPRMLRSIGLGLVALICVGYLSYLLANIYLPPKLTVTNPPTNIATDSKKMNIEGYTEKESEVYINGNPISVSVAGHFSKEVNLKNGVNQIVITAQKKNKRKQVVTREILFKEKEKTEGQD